MIKLVLGLAAATACVVLAGALLAGCSSSSQSPAQSCDVACASNLSAAQVPAPPADTPVSVSVLTYTIRSDADHLLQVTYFSSGGETQATHTTSGVWTKMLNGNAVRIPIVNAQGDGSGTYIACSITEDGEVLSSNRSTGQFATVTCQPKY